MKTSHAVAGGLILTAGVAAYTAALYPSLPELIPIHWGIDGKVDGWAPKAWAAWFGPGAMGLMLGLLFGLPWLSPRQFQVESFRGTFNYLMLLVTALFGYIHVVCLQTALHPQLDSGRVLISGLMLFMAALGNVLGKTRRNYWIGIRTPWTLASDRVWNATHRLGARLLVAAGLLGAAMVWAGVPVAWVFWLLMAALLAPAVHSLILYKRWEGQDAA
jgi:uncharacterized membrane protein